MTHRGITPQQELFMAILLIGIAMAVISKNPDPEPPPPPPPPPVPVVVEPVAPPEKLPQIRPISGEGAFFGELSFDIPSDSDLAQRLLGVAREIEEKGRAGGFDGVEVVGHADTTPLNFSTFDSKADLDTLMAGWLRGDETVSLQPEQGSPLIFVPVPSATDWARRKMIPSNVDLAMLRALAVVKFLQKNRGGSDWPSLDFIRVFLPLSAGAFISPDSRLDQGLMKQEKEIARKRRRIEFHLFKTADRLSGQGEELFPPPPVALPVE